MSPGRLTQAKAKATFPAEPQERQQRSSYGGTWWLLHSAGNLRKQKLRSPTLRHELGEEERLEFQRKGPEGTQKTKAWQELHI